MSRAGLEASKNQRRWARVSRGFAFAAFAAGGCLVSFEDYPVEDSGSRGGSIGQAGAGGRSGAEGAGGSGAMDASVGGSSTGGSFTGGSSMGGSSMGGSSTGGSSTGGTLGAAGSAGTVSGAGGAPSDARMDSDAGCNHDCCGGACVGGKCQPHVIYEGGAAEPLEEIAVYGGYVYFSSSSTQVKGVMKIPVSGGTPGTRVTIWTKRPYVRSIAADATGVYVAGVILEDAGASGLVERVSPDGQAPVTLDMNEDASNIVLEQEYAYWLSGNSTIRRWRKTGGTANPVGGTTEPLRYFLAARSGHVFLQKTADNQIVQRDGAGGDHELARGEPQVSSLAVNDAYVFWPRADVNKIRRVVVSGSNPTDLVADTRGTPTYMVADNTHVYWLTATGALRAARADIPGDATDLATDLASPRRLAHDAACLYVTYGGGQGKIVRVAKP